MDHSHHMMDPMDPMPMCKMSMTLTTDYENVCVLSSSWMITSVQSLVLSLVAVFALSAGYELLKNWTARWEARSYKQPSLSGTALQNYKVKSSILYGVSVLYSFMIMLIFMTFNVWLMAAVVLGSIAGRYVFGFKDNGAALPGSIACH
ncbi:hypothetical protein KL942_003361 [Ogataea angusta]|uniref:Copper transport protein n=1 Tax=Pichia angusta TaxID=870730 RepID=A0AAN6DET7_PICAN|nr:uncharacterized protein KL928_003744 [Ogataea angusta]KAG7817845.1 hypothetical protein KL928_003744 [Ogataea angusta]KAG7827736.1 hypothetical protein KL920_004499 [Ogataea angusta]KAG7839750.1 hypothetical protein KL942_003361 [Ogataea angusta]KAG7849383.1 hypothetical protein KL940_003065 [Ogataea angusta]KAG7856379.1 hypothetical protein KL939_004031 [Ogataea angusta]